ALVVDVEGTAPALDGAVVEDGRAGGGHPLADAPREHRGALAVEVALEAVANGLVEQHARPARPEHDGHLARGRGARFEIGERGVDGGADIAVDDLVGEIVELEATAPPATSMLAPPLLFGRAPGRQPLLTPG